jgi:hypothetical protein
MKHSIVFILCAIAQLAYAQELYIATEPASNMPAKSIGLRLNNYVSESNTMGHHGLVKTTNFKLNPEIMWGVNKQLMFHANGYFSNMHNRNFVADGASLYAKYRFYSIDNMQSHFRLAAYTKAALVQKGYQYEEINLSGDNTGLAAGIVATQLLHKLAISANGGYTKVFNTTAVFVPNYCFNYSLSFGYLLLPFKYKNYNQTNVNLYTEFLGKSNPQNKTQFIDALTAIQFIIKSKMRVDVAYRKQINGNMFRVSNSEFMLRFEYNLFNAYN